MKKHFRTALSIMAVLLVLIAGFYVFLRTSTAGFNETLRSSLEDSSLQVEIAERGGDTDSWTKGMTDGSTLTGTIFEAKVKNTGSYEISDWAETIPIATECYLNNGWCGTFEVTQASGVTQTIDLRSYSIEDVQLDYILEGQDLMIVLHPGDVITYHPSAEVYEMPLQPGSETTVGFILYYADQAPDFSQAEASFHYNKSYQQTSYYKVFLVLAVLWGIAAIVIVCLAIFSVHTARTLEKRERNLEESISIFSGFVDAKDTYTNGHSKRVAIYAEKIAKALGYSADKCRDVYYIGLMHDCGKCYIPDEILKKPGALTGEEYAAIKSHTTKGAELLEGFSSLEGIRDGALYHHERYDGKGYPSGLAGKDIPEIGRILCIADSYDAMNSKRVYRDPLSKEKIRQELTDNSGTQFDPDILEVFLKLLDAGEIH